MKPSNVPEIREAKDLLRSAEKEFPSDSSVRLSEEAFEILNDYLDDEPVTAEAAKFISNLKLSFASAVFLKIYQVQEKDFFRFMSYFTLFHSTMKEEYEMLCEQHPELIRQLDQFKSEFQLEINDLLDKVLIPTDQTH